MKRQYIEFKITHQQIVRTDDFFVVGGSKNYLWAKFSLCDDWAGETVTAIFTGGGHSFSQILENGECLVPWEVLLTKKFFVSCFAGSLITANAVRVDVCPCGATDADPSCAPTPTAYEQIMAAAESAKADAEAARKAAEKAVGGEIDPALIEQAVNDYLEENPPGQGADGKSAYEIACDNGFEGTEAEWLASLHGKDGKDGAPGKDGENGEDGADGQNGADGEDGYTPVRGTDYWTPDDIAEIKSYVDEAILGGAW